MTVHNHGTEEGKGLACHEQMIDGKLRGECMTAPVPSNPTLREQAFAIALSAVKATPATAPDSTGQAEADATVAVDALMPLFASVIAEAEQRGRAEADERTKRLFTAARGQWYSDTCRADLDAAMREMSDRRGQFAPYTPTT